MTFIHLCWCYLAEECTILWVRSVQFYGYGFGGTVFFHLSVIMHSFNNKIVSNFGHFLHKCALREFWLSLGLHWVYQHKGYSFLMWDIICESCSQWWELHVVSIMRKGYSFLMWDMFCESCSQWQELVSIMRKGRHFLIIRESSKM